MKQIYIQALKKTVLTKRPSLTQVSSFTVARASVWEQVHNLEEAQKFGLAMDCCKSIILTKFNIDDLFSKYSCVTKSNIDDLQEFLLA